MWHVLSSWMFPQTKEHVLVEDTQLPIQSNLCYNRSRNAICRLLNRFWRIFYIRYFCNSCEKWWFYKPEYRLQHRAHTLEEIRIDGTLSVIWFLPNREAIDRHVCLLYWLGRQWSSNAIIVIAAPRFQLSIILNNPSAEMGLLYTPFVPRIEPKIEPNGPHTRGGHRAASVPCNLYARMDKRQRTSTRQSATRRGIPCRGRKQWQVFLNPSIDPTVTPITKPRPAPAGLRRQSEFSEGQCSRSSCLLFWAGGAQSGFLFHPLRSDIEIRSACFRSECCCTLDFKGHMCSIFLCSFHCRRKIGCSSSSVAV